MSSAEQVETLEFQAETKKLLDIVIHSLYTHKEIFLRELISNASDALDRLRFESLTSPELVGEGWEGVIRLETDKPNRTLTISDNGVGMSRQEVIDNIGSIAKSGTRDLVEKVKSSKDGAVSPELIGNFGVGFYSAFMVADKVTIVTRRAGDETAVRWESSADGAYTLSPAERDGHGTTITLHLKPVDLEGGIEDFTNEHVLQRTVKRHSDFISYPVKHKFERWQEEEDEQGFIVEGGRKELVTVDETLNSQKPIWARPEADVPEEEFSDFYRYVSSDWDDPMLRISVKAEGVSEYEALLYVPSRGPRDLYLYGAEYGLKLYARRVLIMERCADLIPQHLRFLRGVVDSSDLPLNISRQTLQENRHITQIAKWLARKVYDALAKLQKDDPEKYKKFWKEFGSAFKEGIATEAAQNDKYKSLLLFESSDAEIGLTALSDYVKRMKDGQEAIYYLSGDSRQLCESSPLLEAFRAKGYEALFLTENVDEIVVQYLTEYEGKKLKSIAAGEFKLDDAEDLSEAAEQHKDLLEALQGKLSEHVKQVRLSSRLRESPACIASDEHDLSPKMERLMRMSVEGGVPVQKRILELNPKHEIVTKLKERYAADPNDSIVGDYAELLHGYALMAEGGAPPDPVRFNKLLASVMARGV